MVGSDSYSGDWALILDEADRKTHESYPVPTNALESAFIKQTQLFLHRVLMDTFQDLCSVTNSTPPSKTTKNCRRPPLHASACEGADEKLKIRGNPDRGTRVPATKSCGLSRAAAQVGMRARSATARCKDQIAADISCYGARHDCGWQVVCWLCGMHCWHANASVDCHEFSSVPSHA